MVIRCRNCGHSEETNKDFFVKLIGGVLPLGGGYAWVAYLFAGTGFALPICAAIIAGGVGMLVFKDKIIEWITNRGYACPKCGAVSWKA
jgi:hypothetical protein